MTGFGWADTKPEKGRWYPRPWFADTVVTQPPNRPKGSVRRNRHGVIGWDSVLRMDGIRGEPYPQNHCAKIWL